MNVQEFTNKPLADQPEIAVYLIDPKGRLLSVNAEGLKVMNLTREANALGREFITVFSKQDHGKIKTYVDLAHKGKTSEFEFISKREKSLSKVYSCFLIPIASMLGSATNVMAVIRDITISRYRDIIHEGSGKALKQLAAGTGIQDVLMTLVETAENARPDMICSILLYDEKENCLRHAIGPSLPKFYNDAVDGLPVASGIGSCGEAAYSRSRVVVRDVQEHPNWRQFAELAAQANIRSCWSEPILSSQGNLLGTFAMYFRVPHEPSETDVDSIRTYAHLAGIAIERRAAEERMDNQAKIQALINEELDLANQKLKQMVTLDMLTGLLNRTGLQRILSEKITRFYSQGEPVGALMLDLDNFKSINDTFGYAVGDLVISEVGKMIKDCIRPQDYVARIGGDEFVVILPGFSKTQSAEMGEKIRLEIARSVLGHSVGNAIKVTASIGVMSMTEEILTLDELLDKGYYVLHKSKLLGKNTVSSRSQGRPFQREKSFSLIETIESLRFGTKFYCVKQPVMRLDDRSLLGYELLSRLKHGTFSAPNDFFHVAMEEKILTYVDRCCLRQALLSSRQIPGGARVHINLFPSTLMETPLQSLISELSVAEEDHDICIEISEQQIIGDPQFMMTTIQALKNTGTYIAIDDVGFGKSCLENLTVLQPDIIKIDKSRVIGVSKDPRKEADLKRLLRVLEGCQAEIIAEGIETEEDLKVLIDCGIIYGQGFLFDGITAVRADDSSSTVNTSRRIPGQEVNYSVNRYLN